MDLDSFIRRGLIVDSVCVPCRNWRRRGQSMERTEGARPDRRRKKTETTVLLAMAK